MEPLPSSVSAAVPHSELMAPPVQLQTQQKYHATPVGVPNYFQRLAGQTLRAELQEIQRPEFGRRFGAVDKRPLDAPPVVLLRLFQVVDVGTDEDREVEIQTYDDISLAGLICMAELFEVAGNRLSYPPTVKYSTTAQDTSYPAGPPPYPESPALKTHDPISERLNRTNWLFGAKFIEPHAVGFGVNNQKHVLFTFSDLAVRLEGNFVLRYRLFDIFSASSKALAECYGQPFKMYSSKDAPPLKKSSMLTKRLSNYGVPVKVRKQPRLPRKNRNKEDTGQTSC
ncbi:velvet factor-domain-containing protein [Mycena filopes]|nr:velvet factor-domain-containing protein [Mycena filopes]